MTFAQQVYNIVRDIPKGSVMTYAQVAARAGSPHACRAVGTALSKNYNAAIPCHRVIRSDGTVGEYNRGTAQKKRLLQQEGWDGLVKIKTN
jgi:O-6-methylguanine DNA methyltransferase